MAHSRKLLYPDHYVESRSIVVILKAIMCHELGLAFYPLFSFVVWIWGFWGSYWHLYIACFFLIIDQQCFQFRREEDAEKAVNDLNNRWFGGRPVYAELSPVTDFREACCRQYEMGECTRSGFCNFMHLKPISRELRRYYFYLYNLHFTFFINLCCHTASQWSP